MNSCSQLFFSFLRIGLFTFGGGYAMIPLIKREVTEKKSWIRKEEFLDMLALAQSAPGPISLNAAVFVGYKVRGYRGALSALAGIVLPSFVIILFVAIFFSKFRYNRVVDAAFKGMRPAVVALILTPLYSLAKNLRFKQLIVALGAAFAIWFIGVSPIYCLIAGFARGVLWNNKMKGR